MAGPRPRFSRSFVTSSSFSKSINGPSHDKLLEVLGGDYTISYSPSSTCVRIYLQSNVIDAVHERQALWRNVLPYIKQHSDKLGLQVSVIDMYHGMQSWCNDVDDDTNTTLPYLLEERKVYELGLKEIQLCQEYSSGPSFITLLGQKYGHKALQSQIPSEEFKLMCASLEDPILKKTLQQYYVQDKNGLPLVHVLQKKKLASNELTERVKVHDILSQAISKGARVALGKDPTKVLSYVSSVAEDEITCGVFNNKSDHSQTCFWFKRVITDLYDQRPSTDTALKQYSDITIEGKKGFNLEATKALNYLKEARMATRYIGLDSTNTFEFLLKWQRNKGLDIEGTPQHSDYLKTFCDKMKDLLMQRLNQVADDMASEMYYCVYQDVLRNAQHCRTLLKGVKERPQLTDQITFYIKSPSSHRPLILYGKSGCGKSIVMATAIRNTSQENKGSLIVTRFVGLTPSCTNIRKLLTSICEQISYIYQCNDTSIPCDYEALVKHFTHLLSLSTKEKPIWLFIDGLDHLSSRDQGLGLSWLPLVLPESVRMIVSVSMETEYRVYPILRSLLKNNEECFIKIPDLNPQESHDFLHHFLALRHRTLTRNQYTVLSDLSLPTSLYWLDSIANTASQWCSSTEISQDMLTDLMTYKRTILSEVASIEANNGPVLTSHTLQYITASRCGLTENELLDILSCDDQVMTELCSNKEFDFIHPLTDIPTLIWSRLLQHLLKTLLTYKLVDGGVMVLQWKNRTIKDIVIDKVLNDDDRKVIVCEILSDYFNGDLKKEKVSEITPDSNGQHIEQDINEESSTNIIAITSDTAIEGDSSFSYSASTDRVINTQSLVIGNNDMYNTRKLIELPHALRNAKRLPLLQELLSDYQWWLAYNTMGLIDELIVSLSYILPQVPLNKLSMERTELKLLQDAFKLSQHALRDNPVQLPVELMGRLLLPKLTNGDDKMSLLQGMLSKIDTPPLLTPIHPYLHTAGEPILTSMSGHQGPITSISTEVHNECLIIITGSTDGSLRSWDCEGSGVIKTFDGHTDQVCSVSLSADGKYVASCGKDKTIRYWLVSTSECLHVMKGHSDTVTGVVCTSKGHKVISGSLDCTVKVWNTEQSSQCKGELLFTIESIYGTKREGKRGEEREEETFIRYKCPVTSLALSSNDTHLVVGLKNGGILMIDIVSGSILHQLDPLLKPIESLSLIEYNNNCQYIMVVSNDTLTTLDASTGNQLTTPVPTITKLEGRMTSRGAQTNDNHTRFIALINRLINDANNFTITLANNGSLAVAGTKTGSIKIYNLHNPSLLSSNGDSTHLNENISINCLSYSPCGKYIISTTNQPVLTVWSSQDITTPLDTINLHTNSSVTVLHVMTDSNSIILAYEDGSMSLWNKDKQVVVKEFKGHQVCIKCLDVTKTEDLLMSGDCDGFVYVWNIRQGKKLRSFREHSSELVMVGFYQQKYLISADKQGIIRIKDFMTANLITQSNVAYKKNYLSKVICDRMRYFDGIAVGFKNGIIKLWKLPKLKDNVCQPLIGHSAPITSILLIHNNKMDTKGCISSAMDGCIRVWDLETSLCLYTLVTDYPVMSASLNPSVEMTTLVYGSSVYGYIGMIWYDYSIGSINDSLLFKLLNNNNGIGNDREITPE